jgi:zinc protease
MSVERVTLTNGLKVLLIPSKSHPVVSLQGWMNFGAADESDDIAGVAHLFEHLLFKGTEKRPVGVIASDIEGLGGDLNAYTSYDQTVMHMTLPRAAFAKGLDILSDSLLNSTVDSDELARERPVILEEIKRRNDMPASRASDAFRKLLFGSHPYARPVIGYDSVVAKISRDEILRQYRQHYNSKNMFLVIAGDFDRDIAVSSCESLFRSLRIGNTPPPRELAQSPKRFEASWIAHDVPDSIVFAGWQAPAAHHPDVAGLDALALILGQGESSRLVKDLALDKAWVRDVGVSCWTPKDLGSFAISYKIPGGGLKKLPEILAQTRALFSQPITRAELTKAQNNLLSSNIYSKETVDGLASRYGYFESVTGDWANDSVYLDQVASLKLEDLEKLKKKYLNFDSAVLSGIHPRNEKAPELKSWPELRPARSAKPAKSPSSHGVIRFEHKGLRVLLRTLPELPVFSARWVGLGGSRMEASAESGIGTLWARTVTASFQDSTGQNWSEAQIGHFLDTHAASLSAVFGRNTWSLQLDGLSTDFDELWRLLAAARLGPRLDEKILAREKKHLIADLKSQADNPANVAGRQLMEALFGDKHPYGRSPLGRATQVSKHTAPKLDRFHERQCAQPQVLSVVGAIDVATLERALEECHLPKVPARSALLKIQNPKSLRAAKTLRSSLPKEQSHIYLGTLSCSMNSADRHALLGLSALLSGQGGRLFVELRDKKSLCYTVAPTHMEGLSGGYFAFYIATSPEREQEAIAALKAEIHRLIQGEISADEWDRARQFFIGNSIIENQRLGIQALSLGLEEIYGHGFEESFRFEERLRSVSVEDLVRVARKYFDTSAWITSIVSPRRK